jgi:hypothetical protein
MRGHFAAALALYRASVNVLLANLSGGAEAHDLRRAQTRPLNVL